MSDEILGRVLRRFLASGTEYWGSEWWPGNHKPGRGSLTLDGHLDDLTEEELIAVRRAGGPDFWERHQHVTRDGPR